MAPTPKRIQRALKTAASKVPTAKLPARAVSRGARTNFTPAPGEVPVAVLRIQILGCTDLIAADRNGTSDPYVVVSFTGRREQTPVVKKSLDPTYDAKSATFDFPLYMSHAELISSIELVVWDKDTFGKDYLGEVSLDLDTWFKNDILAFEDERLEPFNANLTSTRAKTTVTGSVHVKIGFVKPQGSDEDIQFSEVFNELSRRKSAAAHSLASAPATEGIGTLRGSQGLPFQDEDYSSDEEDHADSDPDAAFHALHAGQALTASPLPSPGLTHASSTSDSQKLPQSPGFFPKVFNKKPSPSATMDYTTSPAGSEPPSRSSTMPTSVSSTAPKKEKKPKFAKHAQNREFNLSAGTDILGIVMLEIHGAENLPKWKNMTRLGWDMDPFVVISFGKKVFRTRVIRHCLNPVWDEKLLFHVRKYEQTFQLHFSILDWDKLSSNDHVGDAHLDLSEIIGDFAGPDPNTGLYPPDHHGTHDMKEFKLPIASKDGTWSATSGPQLKFRAKFQSYDALRQHFWRHMLEQYDTDDTGLTSHLEMTSMLDSLGSTLTHDTINSFFTRFGKDPTTEEITFDEAVQCLETEICRPEQDRKTVSRGDSLADSAAASTPHTPQIHEGAQTPPFQVPPLDDLDFSGPPARHHISAQVEGAAGQEQRKYDASVNRKSLPLGDQTPVLGAANTNNNNGGNNNSLVVPYSHTSTSTPSSDTEDPEGANSTGEPARERVINIKACPLCHRPRMSDKAEVDIVTHIAICASQDWASVDRIVVGNYVTASQAQRKWYTKVIGKVSSGAYQLGANSANIIVQNRLTGMLEEEKMQGYVRFGIRLLYKGAKGRMEGNQARRLLKSLSIKQGKKYDSPESAKEIPGFIAFHNLIREEIKDPLDSFKTFNEFFYRKLQEKARTVSDPADPTRLVSVADCRMMAFETVTEATSLWIKGREFTVGRLLGQAYQDQAQNYVGGALAIFRLAPQDYHRFHVPVDGRIGPMTYIAGEYYTVNPQAIRTSLDVYGENARKIVPINSPVFGRVMAVCIGAMMVGSIITTVKEGDEVVRGQEFGYFAFGGSTIVLLFEKGVVEWDEDLLQNGRSRLETLVRVGMGVGKGLRPVSPGMPKPENTGYISYPP